MIKIMCAKGHSEDISRAALVCKDLLLFIMQESFFSARRVIHFSLFLNNTGHAEVNVTLADQQKKIM